MGYHYSDPTAAAAMGNLNREYTRMVKRAKLLRKLYEGGKLSPRALEQAQKEFKGLYKNVLSDTLSDR